MQRSSETIGVRCRRGLRQNLICSWLKARLAHASILLLLNGNYTDPWSI